MSPRNESAPGEVTTRRGRSRQQTKDTSSLPEVSLISPFGRLRRTLCGLLRCPSFDRRASLIVDDLIVRIEDLEAENRQLRLDLDLGGRGDA